MIYIGIDPGLDGAVAAIDDAGRVVAVADAPVAQCGRRRDFLAADMARILRGILQSGPACAAIELVHSMPEQSAVSAFCFGRGYGMWLGCLASCGIPVDMVSPQRWKGVMLADMPREKDSSRVRAQQLWPDLDLSRKKDHNRGDALLIAEYLRRQFVKS